MSQTLKASSTRDNTQMIERARKRLSKRAKRGFRGYPLAPVALYGPDDRTATKLAVGIVPAEHADATELPGPGSPRNKRRRQYRSGLLSKLCLWRCTQRHHKAQANIDAAAPRFHRFRAAQLGLLQRGINCQRSRHHPGAQHLPDVRSARCDCHPLASVRGHIDEHRIVETTVKDCQLLEPRRLYRDS